MASHDTDSSVKSSMSSGTGSLSSGSAQSSKQIADGTTLLEGGEPTGSSVIEPDSIEWNGRTFHSYDEGAYLLPNDGPEQDRLDIQHAMLTLMLDGQYGLAPFKEPPLSVLDIATGTGIWPLEFARDHPESRVIGTDLSLIQPRPDVPNCEFYRENSEKDEWIFPCLFDYIHCRYCAACFDDINIVIQKAFDYLRPGGYVEFFDADLETQFEGDSGEGSAWKRYGEAFQASLVNQARDPLKVRRYKDFLKEAGFVDIIETIIPNPFSPWMSDPKFKKIGMFGRADAKFFLKGMHKLLMAAGLSRNDVDELGRQMEKELDECKIHFWFNDYVVYGRKPYESEMTDAQKANWKARQQKVALL